jgi:hypothetical protein
VNVALFLFNRPDHTRLVFERIAAARPERLFLVADGPRTPAEGELCDSARDVVRRVDWPCEVATDFSKVNLGCRVRVASGVSWVLEQVDEAIILEDDCLPHQSFFPFCLQLLERFRDEDRVMSILGANRQLGRRRTSQSYYFSRHFWPWGWATWRRAWKHYDVEMRRWPQVRSTRRLREAIGDEAGAQHVIANFDLTYRGAIDTWDHQWMLACWLRGGLMVVPEVNLVSNIGFGRGAHHTTESWSPLANLPTGTVNFPLTHPSRIAPSKRGDEFAMRQWIAMGRPWSPRALWRGETWRRTVHTLRSVVRRPS